MKKKLIALTLALALLAPSGMLTQTLALQTQAADSDALQLSKNISTQADENGAYTITLESYTTGAVTMGETANPLDIILVLDQSGSMIYDFEGNETATQEEMIQYALKNAVSNFVDTVYENAA